MTLEQFVSNLWARCGLDVQRKQVQRVLAELVEEIGSATARGESVHIPGLGVFERRYRVSRNIRNPVTSEPMRLPKTHSLGFRASKHQKGKER
jgi:nucleoid DNA-binding protein